MQKQDEKHNGNKKLFKANKKRLRKARNSLLQLENCTSESNLKDNNRDLSKWNALFGNKDLTELQEQYKNSSTENEKLKELLKSQREELHKIHKERMELENEVEQKEKSTSETLKRVTAENERFKEMLKSQEEEFKKVQEEKKVLGKEVLKQAITIVSLKQSAKKHKTKKERLKEMSKSQSEELDKIQGEKSILVKDVEEMESTIETLKHAAAENESLKEIMESQREELVKIQREKKELEEAVKSKESTIQTVAQAAAENESLKETLTNQRNELEKVKEEKREAEKDVLKKASTIETLKQDAKKLKTRKDPSISESSIKMEKKIKELSEELRRQRGIHRQLKMEVNNFKENTNGFKKEQGNSNSDEPAVKGIKRRTEKRIPNVNKNSRGINANFMYARLF